MRDRLAAAWPDHEFEIVPIETRGDRLIDRPLPEIGGKGLFTEALEAALLEGAVHVAVHSLKDLPTDLPESLGVGAVCERDDARDVWVSSEGGPASLREAAPGARVGTGSERRRAQLLALRGDVEVRSIRGNVETRLRKLDEGGYDALIMAAAGLRRLGLATRITDYFEPPDWLPAPGQGAVAVENRLDDPLVAELLRPIEDSAARATTLAERTLLATLQGGCQIPVGAYAQVIGNELRLDALVATADGHTLLRAQGVGEPGRAAELGAEVAADLLMRGADAIVAAFREVESHPET